MSNKGSIAEKLAAAGWEDLSELVDNSSELVIDLSKEEPVTSSKRKLKRSRKQVALLERTCKKPKAAFTGAISVPSFAQAFLSWKFTQHFTSPSSSSSEAKTPSKLRKVPLSFKVRIEDMSIETTFMKTYSSQLKSMQIPFCL